MLPMFDRSYTACHPSTSCSHIKNYLIMFRLSNRHYCAK